MPPLGLDRLLADERSRRIVVTSFDGPSLSSSEGDERVGDELEGIPDSISSVNDSETAALLVMGS